LQRPYAGGLTKNALSQPTTATNFDGLFRVLAVSKRLEGGQN